MQAVMPLYGLAEAGVHWFATYQTHHLEKLGMSTSCFDPCVLLTKPDEPFGFLALQTDDTLFVRTTKFVAREREEIQKAGFLSKPPTKLVPDTPTPFNGTMITLLQDGRLHIGPKGQANKLELVDLNASREERTHQFVIQRARGAYIAMICQPQCTYVYSVSAQA